MKLPTASVTKSKAKRSSSKEIQPSSIKVSCSYMDTTVPGGHIYEDKSASHRRHREVYRSNSAGKVIAHQAKPLGRRNVFKKVRKNSNELARLKKKNAIMKDGKKEMLRRTSSF